MKLSQSLLPELDHEMATTRKLLVRVPDDCLDWQPHEKSMSLGRLATHIADLIGWAPTILQQESLDAAPPGGPPISLATLGSMREILETFDANVPKTRAAIASADDATLMQPWTLLKGGKVVFSLPRMVVLRSMVINHTIHHRGQLSVYLRINNVPLPVIYVQSADEG